jgi:hypothetical protein
MYVRTLSLFTEPRPSSQGPSAFVVSILVHGALFGLLSYGFMHTPRIDEQTLSKRYAVRRLDLHTPEPQMRPAAGTGVRYPGPQRPAHAIPPGSGPAAGPSGSLQIALLTPAQQTLIQPDLPRNLTLPQEIPIPTVMTWIAQKSPATTIVLPQPQEATAADIRPSADVPNAELNLADTSIASNDSAVHTAAPAPGTTSPIVAPGPELVQLVPVTTSETDEQPTPAAVIALSDLQMREGTVNLPPANETSTAVSPPEPEILAEHAQTGDGNPASANAGAVAIKGVNAGPVQQAGLRNQPSIAHITLPKKGKFGVVVVGSPLQQDYPEMVQIWGDRMAYTVYLHVGLAKNWILQYSLPRATEVAAAGSIAPLEAPWPYDIARPRFALSDFNANALVLHGFVNKAGRFESLAIVYPPQFAQAEFVLYTLQRWQFRPARKNGRTAAVEVVLIVPNDLE